jgi:hypothetical protein
MKNNRRFVKTLTFMLTVIFTVTSFGFVSQANGQSKIKNLKYETGSIQIKQATKIKVSIEQEQITCQPELGQSFSIPLKAIKEVAYDTKSQRRTTEAAILAAASPLGGIILYSIKKTKHYVSIVWDENGVEKDVIFLVPKNEKTSLLNELQAVTGKPWRDLDAEQKRTTQELEAEKKNAVSLQLDRTTYIGHTILKAGIYQVVFLNRGNGKGELYFFGGKKVKPEKSLAALKVEVTEPINTVSTTQVGYQEKDGKALISEIQMPTKVYKTTN